MYALAVFDGQTALEPDMAQILERTLRSSDRCVLAMTVKLKAAPLATSASGTVIALALADVPANLDDQRIVDRLEIALDRIVARGSKIGGPRNLAIAGLGDDPKVVGDGVTALRHLLSQVGDSPEPFGKVLRLLTPMGIDSDKDPIARRMAAQKLRTKMTARINDMLRDAETSKK